MVETGLLLPDEPLFLVDRSLRTQRSSRHTSDSDSQPFSNDDLRIIKAGSTSKTAGTQSLLTPSSSSRASSARQDFQFVAATEPGGRQNRNARRAVRQHARRYDRKHTGSDKDSDKCSHDAAETSAPICTDADPYEKALTTALTITHAVPTSTSLLYGFHQGQDPTGLEQFLHYCQFSHRRG